MKKNEYIAIDILVWFYYQIHHTIYDIDVFDC